MGKNHRTREQARRSRRAATIRSRARWRRMYETNDYWRRERRERRDLEDLAERAYDDSQRLSPDSRQAYEDSQRLSPDSRQAYEDSQRLSPDSRQEPDEEWRNDRQERDRELDEARSEAASRLCRERDAIEWGARFGPAARDAGLRSAEPRSGKVGRV